MEKAKSTQLSLIKAFDESKTKSVSDLCRIAGVSRFAFYYHFKKDANFRKELFTKQQAHLTEKIAAA